MIKTFVLLTIEEFRLELKFMRRYMFSTVTTFAANLIVMTGIILVSMPSISYGRDTQAVLQLSNATRLIGFLYFFLGMSSLGLPESTVSSSRQLGTIENLALSPLGISGVIAAKFLPSYVSVLVQVYISIALIALALKLPIILSIGPVVLNSLIAATGMLGLGFLFGGLTIRFRHLGLLKNLLFVLLFAMGIMPMGYEITGTFSSFARFFPFTQGLMRTRASLIPDLKDTTSVSLPLFISCSVVLLVVGILVFRKFERDSLKRGTLISY